MSKYQEIAVVLLDDKYTGLTDEQAATEMNVAYIASKQAIATADIEQFIMMQGAWAQIYQGTSSASVTAVGALAKFPAIDVRDPDKQAVLDFILQGLLDDVAIPAFIQAHKDAIMVMGDTLISDADSIGYSVNAGDIQAARTI